MRACPAMMIYLQGCRYRKGSTNSPHDKNPLNAKFVIELSVCSKGHLMELLEPILVCSFCKFIKHCFDRVIGVADDTNGKISALSWIIFGRCHPIGGGLFHSTTLEIGINQPVVLFSWK